MLLHDLRILSYTQINSTLYVEAALSDRDVSTRPYRTVPLFSIKLLCFISRKEVSHTEVRYFARDLNSRIGGTRGTGAA